MAVYSRRKKAGLKYWYKFDYKGKTHYSRAIFDTRAEARKAESEKYNEVSNQGKTSPEVNLGLLHAIEERLDYVQIKKSKSYYEDNKRYYSKLYSHFGDIPIIAITKKQMQDFLLNESKEAHTKGIDNYSINAMLNVYKALFNYAIDNYELIMRNPCKSIEPFPVKQKLKYIPTDEDIKAVQAICDEKQKLLIDFVKETGARINEPLKITGNDITPEYVILYTKKSKFSNLVPRKLPLPVCIKKISIDRDERLFPYWKEKPKFLERKVKELNQSTWNWHNLRHRRASLWNKEGKSLFEIMTFLGHSNLSTTQKYLQLLP